jgi:hypothetical protein
MIDRRDIEEAEETLDHEEPDSFEFWKDKQKELVTNVVDYNLGTLADLVKSGTISLSPGYQRRFRWSSERQSLLIESFLMNVPVPPVFLNEDEYGEYSIIDGKQRISAIVEFFRGRLKLTGLQVFSDLNGSTFDDVTPKLRRVLETRPNLRAVIILRQSDPDVKFEVFQRLNTGGVRLNPQEIRNSVCRGPFNDLLLRLSENRVFHQLLGIRRKETSAIWREMRDVEFVLRYFTFRDSWETFTGGIRRHMDEFMSAKRKANDSWLEKAEADFLSTLGAVKGVFGEHAFQRWQPEKGTWRQQVLASLYDAQMFACKALNVNGTRDASKDVIKAYKELFKKETFRKSIDAATNTPKLFKERIIYVRDLLRDHLR